MMALGLLAYSFYRDKSKSAPYIRKEPTPVPSPELTPEELKEARKKFEQEMDAFSELMGYNANQAYGITPMEDK